MISMRRFQKEGQNFSPPRDLAVMIPSTKIPQSEYKTPSGFRRKSFFPREGKIIEVQMKEKTRNAGHNKKGAPFLLHRV